MEPTSASVMDQRTAVADGTVRVRSVQQNEPPIPNKPSRLLGATIVKINDEGHMNIQARIRQLEYQLQATTKERDDVRDSIHQVFDDVIFAEDRLDEEKALTAKQSSEINRLMEDQARLLEEITLKDEELENTRRLNEDQKKAIKGQASELESLQHRFDATIENLSRNGAATAIAQQAQRDLEEKVNAKEGQLQEMAEKMAVDRRQSQSRLIDLESQLEMLKQQCIGSQERQEAAEAQLRGLHEGALVQDSQVKDIAELRRLLAWHQKIGEEASKHARQSTEENRKLREMIVGKDEKLQGQKALLDRMRKPAKAPPGSFP